MTLVLWYFAASVWLGIIIRFMALAVSPAETTRIEKRWHFAIELLLRLPFAWLSLKLLGWI